MFDTVISSRIRSCRIIILSFILPTMLLASACDGSGSTVEGGGVPPGGGSGGIGDVPPAATTTNPSGDAPATGGGSNDNLQPGQGISGGGGSGGSGVGVGGGGTGGTDVTITPATNSSAMVAFTKTPNDEGLVEVGVQVVNTTAFQIVSEIDNELLGTRFLVDPQGNTVLDSDFNDPPKTTGLLSLFFADFNVNTLPYPTSGSDSEVQTGQYVQTMVLSTTDTFNGTVIAKNDTLLDRGVVRGTVFLVGDEVQSSRGAINTALNVASNIFQDMGITLSLAVSDIESSTGVVPHPTLGSDFYRNATAGSPEPGVFIFIADQISGDDTTSLDDVFDAGVLGIASAIPGPAISTKRSGVAISMFAHEGGDGSLDGSDITQLGNTIAHELAHYLGLFHPVECADGLCSEFFTGDTLSDTSACSTIGDCTADGTVDNLMFPTAVPGRNQDNVTNEQSRVVNLQVAVQ